MTPGDRERKIREIAATEYKLDPGLVKALYLEMMPKGSYRICFMDLGGVSQPHKSQKFADWLHQNHPDLLK